MLLETFWFLLIVVFGNCATSILAVNLVFHDKQFWQISRIEMFLAMFLIIIKYGVSIDE